MILREFAPAKINLFLHVLGKRDDGYHALSSLVTFANFGDELSFEAGGKDFTLTTSGINVEGNLQDNLVLKAARAFKSQYPQCPFGHFHLVKNLPVASGMGGGSSDAAASLRLLYQANGAGDILAIAKTLGADVPMCIDMKTRSVGGIGHDFGEEINFQCDAILINPLIAISTQDVFKRFKLLPKNTLQDRNDLEQAAIEFAPPIGELLTTLKQLPHMQVARMSGSGATCFALFKTKLDASAALTILHERYPKFWCKQVVLGL